MAALDYGTIIIKNGKHIHDNDNGTGAMSEFTLPNIVHMHRQLVHNLTRNTEDNTVFDTYRSNKKVWYYNIADIPFKTKMIYDQTMLTTFTHNGDHYDIIHGYDVDTKWIYDWRRLHVIKHVFERLTHAAFFAKQTRPVNWSEDGKRFYKPRNRH